MGLAKQEQKWEDRIQNDIFVGSTYDFLNFGFATFLILFIQATVLTDSTVESLELCLTDFLESLQLQNKISTYNNYKNA